jgi:2-iminobutanoate/2-iminopropanoate deaminase
MTRQVVTGGPPALGPYAKACWDGDRLYCSGQTPIDPDTGALVDGDIATQTGQVLANLAGVLEAAGLSMDHVVKANVYLTNMAHFGAMNQVYSAAFSPPFPARTTVAVAALPLGALVEIELIARRDPA